MRRIVGVAELLGIAVGSIWVSLGLPSTLDSGPPGDLVSLCVWALRAVATWLAGAALLSTLTALPRPGRHKGLRRFTARVAPRGLRDLADLAVRGTVGLATVAAIATPATAFATTHAPRPLSGHHPYSDHFTLDWPAQPRPRAPRLAPAPATKPRRPSRVRIETPLQTKTHTPTRSDTPATPVARAARPTASAPSTGQSKTAVPVSHSAQSPDGHPRPHRAPPDHSPGERHSSEVVVRAGDSLWSIAAAHLPGRADAAAIVAAWHAWWDANRAVIGADPDLIYPGQRLVAPSMTRASASSSIPSTSRRLQ